MHQYLSAFVLSCAILVDLSQIFWELSPQNVYDKRDYKPVLICVHDCQIPIYHVKDCVLSCA